MKEFYTICHLGVNGSLYPLVNDDKYVIFLSHPYILSLVSQVHLIYRWGSVYNYMPGVSWNFICEFWKENVGFYDGLSEYCTIISFYFGILLSHMGRYLSFLVWNSIYISCMYDYVYCFCSLFLLVV